MAACAVCGTDLPPQRGPRARRYCSRACQAKAYRARQEQRTGHRAAATDEQRLVAEYDAVPSRQLADSLALSAGRIAGALAAGQAADDHDLGVLACIPVVLAARAHRAAARADELPTSTAAPSVTVLHLATPPERDKPSRDDSAPPTTTPPAARRPRPATKTSRDESEPARLAPGGPGIEPRPQKLPKKKASAIVDAAELVRDPEHRDNHRWILQSGDTVLGYVQPSYGGVSRSGRNGWISRLAGMPGPRGTTRDAAAADLAMRWIRLVTAAPKRTITGTN